MQGACVAAVEFVNLMTETGRLPAAAHILGYVDSTTLRGGPAWASQVADARVRLAGVRPATEPCRDHREALEYMHRSLP